MQVNTINVTKEFVIRDRNVSMLIKSPIEMSPDIIIELTREVIAVDESGTSSKKVTVAEHAEKTYSVIRRGSAMYNKTITLSAQFGGITLTGAQVFMAVEALTDLEAMADQDTTPPTVPSNLIVTNTTPASISLSWKASTDAVGVKDYLVFNGSVCVAESTSTTCTVSRLVPNTTYAFTVRARDFKNNTSLPSSEVQSTTDVDSEAPSIPANVTATAISSSQIDIGWDASTDNVGVSGYLIHKDGEYVATVTDQTLVSSEGDDFDAIRQYAFRYSAMGLSANTEYSFAVKANDSSGNESDYSIAAKATTQGA